MFGKLMKHEWRAFSKVPVAVNIFLVVFTLLGIFSMHSGLWKIDNKIIETLLLLLSLFYLLALVVISCVVPLYSAIRFYKNMFTDEGYLMHTLPVSKGALIFSKLLVSFLWTVITTIIMSASILSLVATLADIAGSPISFTEAIRELFTILLSDGFRDTVNISFTHFSILMIVFIIFSTFSGLLQVYAAISLGQLFSKHKVAGSILSYIGIFVVLESIESFLSLPILFNSIDTFTFSIAPYIYISIAEAIILSVVFFFLSEWLMKKKLNLD